MKKTLLLAAAALFAASNVWALDMFVIGANVDGKSWELGTNKMTQTGEGTYEWSGSSLANEFKINDGTWDAAHNIGMGDDGSISLDTPYKYYMGDASGNITFNGFSALSNPKIVLDMNAGTIVLSGTPGEVTPPDPSEITFYIIGTNVNGKNWALQESDCAFTDKGNGIYEWTGEILGTGFKINDGTWGDTWNIGSNGADIDMNTPYFYGVGGSTGNIGFNGFTEIINPVVELNINDETITLKGGESAGDAQWYIMGINNNWEFIPDYELLPVDGEEGVYVGEITVVEQAGEFKISDTGWAHELGTNFPEDVFISPEILKITLDDVYGEGGNISYELEEGVYTVIFDHNEYTLEFKDASDDAVESIIAEEGTPVYYNLHGQKVANPERGIFVKVVNGKASKVVK